MYHRIKTRNLLKKKITPMCSFSPDLLDLNPGNQKKEKANYIMQYQQHLY